MKAVLLTATLGFAFGCLLAVALERAPVQAQMGGESAAIESQTEMQRRALGELTREVAALRRAVERCGR